MASQGQSGIFDTNMKEEGMVKKWRREKKERKEAKSKEEDVKDDIGILKKSYYLTKVGVMVATGNAHKTSLPRQ